MTEEDRKKLEQKKARLREKSAFEKAQLKLNAFLNQHGISSWVVVKSKIPKSQIMFIRLDVDD